MLYGSEVKSTMTQVKATANQNHVYKYRVGQRNLGAPLKHNFSNSIFVAFNRTQVTIKKDFSCKYPTDPPSRQTFLHLTRKKNTHMATPVSPWKIEFYNESCFIITAPDKGILSFQPMLSLEQKHPCLLKASKLLYMLLVLERALK